MIVSAVELIPLTTDHCSDNGYMGKQPTGFGLIQSEEHEKEISEKHGKVHWLQ